ncbi:hypothetical protein K3495_g4194 [Podosphaera aphanis]|nr:hypothetical protein K3495_g4194 [Podosphaera aphanis]
MTRHTTTSGSPQPPREPDVTPAQPMLTKENFEKELQLLAAKAQEETVWKWASEQVWILVQVAALYVLAATSANVSLLNLSPVYGGLPSTVWHSKIIWVSCFAGWSMNLFMQRQLPVKPRQTLPLIAAYIPVAQFFLFKISGSLGIVYGPLIIESLTLFPLLIGSISVAANILDNLDLKWRIIPLWLSDSLPGILSISVFKTLEFITAREIQKSIGSSFFQTRLGLQMILAGAYSIFAPSKLLLYILPAILHTAFFNTHVPSPYATSSLKSTLNQSGWSLLERQESSTGYISVIESHQQKFRLMRCDHSVLGGEWLLSAKPGGLAEPIYGIFVMLEAVRLVDVKDPVPDAEATALVIGLGIGTTPAALIRHGIQTTVVEIDPVVYDFSRKYFDLPDNHTSVVADAISYAADVAQTDVKYDYVIHDVFTGGAEPVELFTHEFLQDLHTILKPGGVIAINYAGNLLLPAARIVIQTIRSIFPVCRMFRESEAPSAAQLAIDGRDFTNLVIFCTNAADEVRFREPGEADFLSSAIRQQFLLPKYEVDYSVFAEREEDGGLLRRNQTDRFREWQQQSARGHWTLMRTVLPDIVWENW